VSESLLVRTDRGLYCPLGDFYIDPVRGVPRAVLTHAHADHARAGCGRYLAASEGVELLHWRLGLSAPIDTIRYGESLQLGSVRLSLHPSGHVLGASQVRIEHQGQVAVVTGDFKLQADPTCRPWEPVRCHHWIPESTFALPVFRWPDTSQVIAQIERWWKECKESGRTPVLAAYALGKSQRLLASLAPLGPIYTHGAVEHGNQAYRKAGVVLPSTQTVSTMPADYRTQGALILAVPAALGSPWMRRFTNPTTALASGWMLLRGMRRQRGVDRGFVVSDHVDWPDWLKAFEAVGPQRVWVAHGYQHAAARYLQERGIDAKPLDPGPNTAVDAEELLEREEPEDGQEDVELIR